MESSKTFLGSWHERIQALRNVPMLLRFVWHAGPGVFAGSLCCRVLTAFAPVSMLVVSKRILDGVQARLSGHALPSAFWFLVAAEFVLAALAAVLTRASTFFEVLVA